MSEQAIYNKNTITITISKRTLTNLIDIVVPITIWLILSFSPCSIDSAGYKSTFYNDTGKNFLHVEWGFYYFCKLAYSLGIKYWAFRSIILGFTFLNFHVSLKRMSIHETALWIYYSFFPLLYNAIQIRFFYAISIAFIGISFLVRNNENNKKRTVLGFITCVAFGCLFHSAVVITLIYLVPTFLDKKRMSWFIVIGMVVELFALFFVNILGRLIQNVISAFRVLVTYYTIKISISDALQFMLTYAVFLVIFLYTVKYVELFNQHYMQDSALTQEYQYFYENNASLDVEKNIAITNILLVWLSCLNSTFSRYFQLSVLLVVTFSLSKKIRNYKNVLIVRIVILVVLAILGYFFLHGRIFEAWSKAFLQIHGFSQLSQLY